MMNVGAFALAASLLGTVTYQHDVKPLLDTACGECHVPDGRDPDLSSFPFTSINADTQAAIVTMVIKAVSGAQPRMPPGSRTKLTTDDIGILQAWQDSGLSP